MKMMMMKIISNHLPVFLLLLFFTGSTRQISACYNHPSIDSTGHTHYIGEFPIHIRLHDPYQAMQNLKRLENQMDTSFLYTDYSLYGIYLSYIGQYEAAKNIFTRLVNKFPGEYAYKANLGTTYELLGQNDSALKYIRESMLINPYAHKGTEWVHIQILEYKIMLQQHPEQKHGPVIRGLQASDTLLQQLSGIQYQLEERIPFTPVGDSLMAKLCEEVGNYWAGNASLDFALLYYTIAKNYHVTYNAGIEQKITWTYNKIDEMNKKVKPKWRIKIPEYQLKTINGLLKKHTVTPTPYTAREYL